MRIELLIVYLHRVMKRLTFIGTVFAAILALSACDPQKNPPRKLPAPNKPMEKMRDPATPTLAPDGEPIEAPTRHQHDDTAVDTKPIERNKIPEPTPNRAPDYAIKLEGKSGYVKSPYDDQGRPIDVRGLPPGTEAEDPYTHRTFLVPP